MSAEQLVYTYDETAAVLGVSVDTVRRLVAAGRIRTVRWNHRLVRVPIRTLHEDIEAMTGVGAEPSSSTTGTPPAVVGGESSAARPAGPGKVTATPHVEVPPPSAPGDAAGLAAEHRIAS